ncbi:MAG: hypothetical protein HYV09_37580 [Deltaproteobacteria bacterium]|nr:hypothetical protein [Deltaproteobacteria bacterium]
MQFVRSVAPLSALVLAAPLLGAAPSPPPSSATASSSAIPSSSAASSATPGAPAAVSAAATSASPVGDTAPPANAPIVLSPGVSEGPIAPAKSKSLLDEAPAEPPPPPRGPWFGYQVLVVDLAIAGTTAALLRTSPEKNHLAIFSVGSALFLAGAPLVHFANDSGQTFNSFLIHAGALAIGSAAGALVIEGFSGCTELTPCKLERVDFAAIGAAAGAIIGTAIDAGGYAFKKAPLGATAIRPVVRASASGAWLGLSFSL